eukprot:836683-Prymnesium_polylepis.1
MRAAWMLLVLASFATLGEAFTGRAVMARGRVRGSVVANANPFGDFLDAAKSAAASASEAAKAAADSLAPIDDEYTSSPEREARLTEQQKIAEQKRRERQDALFETPPSEVPSTPKNPLE